jgi:colanic acid/amylovoran biosynthesis glycosyltransferase
MNKGDRPLVLHYVWKYLPVTEVWIHSQITLLHRYHPVVVTREKENLDLFPVSPIHTLPRCNRSGRIADVLNLLIRRSRLDRLMFMILVCWYRPEVVHVHFGDSGWENLFLKRILRRKYIVSFYGYDYGSLSARNPVWHKRYKMLFQKGDAFIVEGSKARNTLASIGCPDDKIFEKHLGVDLLQIEFTERKHPGPGETIRLLQAATFVEKKGHRFTVDAFAKALEKVPNLSLTFIGSGKLQPEIQQLVRDLGVESRVDFFSPLPYRALMRTALAHHIFIQPSIHASDGDCEGGAPVVLLDMQASGMPVISTRHCDIPEYVQDRITGFLVEEKDADALAERIIYLATHGERWPLMGRQGREHISRQYNAKTQTDKLEGIYDKVLGKGL